MLNAQHRGHRHNPLFRPRVFKRVAAVSALVMLVSSALPAGADDYYQPVIITPSDQAVIVPLEPLTNGTDTFPDGLDVDTTGSTFTPAPLLSVAALGAVTVNPAGQMVPGTTFADDAEKAALTDLSSTAVADALAAHELPSSDGKDLPTTVLDGGGSPHCGRRGTRRRTAAASARPGPGRVRLSRS